MFRFTALLCIISTLSSGAAAFQTNTYNNKELVKTVRTRTNNLLAMQNYDNNDNNTDRRNFLGKAAITFGTLSTFPLAARSEGKKSLSEEYRQGTAALADMDSDAPVPREAYKKLPSGTIYADLRTGNGNNIVDVGSKVNLQWVLRKSNGYFVDSSERNDSVPFIFTVGSENQAIIGVDEGIRGMSEGGVRRLLIPPKLAYVKGLDDGCPGPLPYGFGPRQQMRRVQQTRVDVPGEYVFLEVQVTRVR